MKIELPDNLESAIKFFEGMALEDANIILKEFPDCKKASEELFCRLQATAKIIQDSLPAGVFYENYYPFRGYVLKLYQEISSKAPASFESEIVEVIILGQIPSHKKSNQQSKEKA